MRHGGKRPGAGRPKATSKTKTVVETEAITAQNASATADIPINAKTPLEHLLAVMNDPTADPERRDHAAEVALRYGHLDKGGKAKPDQPARPTFATILGGKK